jgi:dTDP-4-amino-4,6-dideoxygalactose transaminase
MTELQSAIGIAELRRFDTWNLPRRRANGRLLGRALSNHPLVLAGPVDTPERNNSYWWFPLLLNPEKLTCSVSFFASAVIAEGVPVATVHGWDLARQKLFADGLSAARTAFSSTAPAVRQSNQCAGACPAARRLAEGTIAFYSHPVLSEAHMQLYVEAFEKVSTALMH